MSNNHIDFNINKKTKKKKNRLFTSVILLLVIVVIGYISGMFVLKTFIYPKKYFDIVKEQASDCKIDPYLIMAMIKTESSFDSSAKSSKDAKGLMQILNSTANDINNKEKITENIAENIYDEEINITIGCKYFASLVKRYSGNYYLAVCAYNAGMGNVDKWINDDILPKKLDEHKNVDMPFKETSKYLDKVISSYKMYKFLYK